MLTYTGYKVYILESKKSIDIVQAVKEDHFDDSHVFGFEQGLNLAVAVYSIYDSTTHQLLDPSYGKIRFSKIQWENGEKEGFKYFFKTLESHICSEEELGLSGHNHKFWPIKKSQKNMISPNTDFFLCFDPYDLEIYGSSFGSGKGQNI